MGGRGWLPNSVICFIQSIKQIYNYSNLRLLSLFFRIFILIVIYNRKRFTQRQFLSIIYFMFSLQYSNTYLESSSSSRYLIRIRKQGNFKNNLLSYSKLLISVFIFHNINLNYLFNHNGISYTRYVVVEWTPMYT